jgi:hypothetical protein
VTRLVFAVAQHLHMTAGAVQAQMGAHELMCWNFLLTESQNSKPRSIGGGVVLSVQDEIAAWK